MTALMRHFVDLHASIHGGSSSLKAKEDHFAQAVELLEPVASQVLSEMNTSLLLESGRIPGTRLRRAPDGGPVASWALSWPERQLARASPILLMAHYGIGSHHPHLGGATVHDSPLNISPDPMPPNSFPFSALSQPPTSAILSLRLVTRSFRRSSAGEASQRLQAAHDRAVVGRVCRPGDPTPCQPTREASSSDAGSPN
jgi:hypothetical protein